jgi:hypothetical protein
MMKHNEQAQLIMSQKKAELKSSFKNSPANPKNKKVAGENLEEQAFLSRVSNLGQPIEVESDHESMDEAEDSSLDIRQ